MEKVWQKVEGVSNMGEDYDFLSARKIGDYVEVAYMAFSGLKVVELTGVTDIISTTGLHEKVVDSFGDDWEIAFAAKTDDGAEVIVTIDSCSTVDCIGQTSCVDCTNSEEFDADTVCELDDSLLVLYDIL